MSDTEYTILVCVAALFAGHLLAIITFWVYLVLQERKRDTDMEKYYEEQIAAIKKSGMTYHV